MLHKYYPLPKGKRSEDREKIVVRTLTILREDLINLQARFKGQQEIAIALRDGMFNASGVMETRASTLLGENIKLLTFEEYQNGYTSVRQQSPKNNIPKTTALTLILTPTLTQTYNKHKNTNINTNTKTKQNIIKQIPLDTLRSYRKLL
ncbi:predicted protein [Sclerotinia sclerotiorum 1980 UF-70]|uniref:Uncharacterized protein n=2 Tax=Sclerotinia sclerotiorum (strain ATCC 18683 / 1980 / Ss-1) TaxID=665079 RepID=A7ECL5_SCLS1|nr:predicted protein [Sclerotinia sclerotiorum 1980 UF-70]APA09148.1 hypothetical protein sscle_04g039180 [Sclerotinia sclerotiorum 1980 UF-70]EDO00194.1 predicted protein [Sclerotinia sclerotiorum 1980 UF-70]